MKEICRIIYLLYRYCLLLPYQKTPRIRKKRVLTLHRFSEEPVLKKRGHSLDPLILAI